MNDLDIRAAAEAGDEGAARPRPTDPCALAIFGVTGDLARRSLVPALYGLWKRGLLSDKTAIVGVSRSPLGDAALRALLQPDAGDRDWGAFASRITALSGDPDSPETRRRLAEIAGVRGNRLFYLATPPAAFPVILRSLREGGLITPAGAEPWTRVVIEKPFGRDLASARDLNRLVVDTLDESQVYRIDHYLGKETVQNILVLRFGNALFESVWNRTHVDHVQITVAEEAGVGGRGLFYEQAGVLRDMVQNHLLQILALVAMEPPLSFRADDIRDERVKLFRALRPLSQPGAEIVWGQYAGYRAEPGVAADSPVPTFAALRVMIDNWRWQGVPFYLRTGKRLRRRLTEVAIQFREIPLCLFKDEEACRRIEPNVLSLRIQPEEGISLRFAAKPPGDDLQAGTVRMRFDYASAWGRPIAPAYERLLLDALRGDPTLFLRADAVVRAWEFVTPIQKVIDAHPGAIETYAPGSEGPAGADGLLRLDRRRWRRME